MIHDLRARLDALATTLQALSLQPKNIHGRVLQAIEQTFHAAPILVLSKRRLREYTEPRFAAIWITYTLIHRSSHRDLAALFNCTRSNIAHSLTRAEDLRQTDPAFRAKTDQILAFVSSDPSVVKTP